MGELIRRVEFILKLSMRKMSLKFNRLSLVVNVCPLFYSIALVFSLLGDKQKLIKYLTWHINNKLQIKWWNYISRFWKGDRICAKSILKLRVWIQRRFWYLKHWNVDKYVWDIGSTIKRGKFIFEKWCMYYIDKTTSFFSSIIWVNTRTKIWYCY